MDEINKMHKKNPQNISETKSWFFQMLNDIHKTSAKLTEKDTN